jgi:hypothetical protein
VNPVEILESHLDKSLLTKEQLKDVEDMFERVLDLGLRAAKGEDVASDLRHVQAQMALFKSGTISATQAALHNAAVQYAQEAGKYLGVIIKTAVGGLI